MWCFKRFVRFALFSLMLILACSAFSSYSADVGDRPGGEVKIFIRNSTFEFQGGILKPEQPGTIEIHNLDKITHGFTSTLLEDVDVQVESNGITTFGKGIKGIHIDPERIVRIHFLPNRPGKFSFRCDLHPNMKGELLVLSIESI